MPYLGNTVELALMAKGASPESVRTGKLTLPLVSYSTQESNPHPHTSSQEAQWSFPGFRSHG